MKKRWSEYLADMHTVNISKIKFIDFTILSQKWIIYVFKGGDRPPRPHG